MVYDKKILRDIKKFNLNDPENFKKYIENMIQDIHKKKKKCKK